MINQTNFFALLATYIQLWAGGASDGGQPELLTSIAVRNMCLRAAAEMIVDGDLPAVRLYREIAPEDMSVHTILSIDGDERVLLFPDDVATLRALILSFDESAPPHVGEPLSMPIWLQNGTVVSVVVEDMLKE